MLATHSSLLTASTVDARRILDPRPRALDHTRGRDIAVVRDLEDQHRVVGVVGDEDFAAALVERHVARPVQLRPRVP